MSSVTPAKTVPGEKVPALSSGRHGGEDTCGSSMFLTQNLIVYL